MSSLRLKVLLSFLSLIMMLGLIFYIGMNFFIKDFYYGKKIEAMNQMVSQINTMYKVSQSADEALMNIEYLGYQFEGKISIYDQDTQMVVFDSKRYQYTKGTIVEEISYKEHIAYVYVTKYPVEGARWLVYIDQLENNKIALMQIPVVAIEEAIHVIQSFFSLLMLISIGIAFLMAIYLSSTITNPIKKIHKVANSIGNLEFDIKYIGKSKDEIGQLGNRLNQISHTLKETIDELQREIEKEKSVDRLRRRFVAQVSHELQTPISIISSYIEALEDDIVTDDELDSYYEVIRDESDKMSRIIKDLLQLSQLEAKTVNFKMSSFELTDFIYSLCSRYGLIAKQKGLEFNFTKMLSKKVEFIGDELRLEQGITNILTNALKHSSKYITVDLTEQKDSLILRIENSGEHIDETELPHLFESFYKGKTSVKKDGTGLGLSIAAQIFQQHQIDYQVYNSQKGVVFEIRFNLHQNAELKNEKEIVDIVSTRIERV